MKNYFFVLVLTSTVSFAQLQGQARLDSLLQALPRASNDTLKARTYNRIVNEYFLSNIDKALYYSRIGLAHARKMKWKKGVGVFLGNIGRAYSEMGRYDSCVYYYNQEATIYREIGEKKNLANTYNNLGAAEQNIKSDYVKAVAYFFKALKEAEALQDESLIGICYGNISNMYGEQKNFSKALTYGLKSLEVAQHRLITDPAAQRDVAVALLKISDIYLWQKDYKHAKNYLSKSIPLFKNTGDWQGLASAYDAYATACDTDYAQKIDYEYKAFQLWEKINPMSADAVRNVGNLGIAYLDKARYQVNADKSALLNKAEMYFRLAIDRSNQRNEIANKAYWQGSLAELQALKGDYKNAYNNFRSFQTIQDSLYSQESKNQIAEIETVREVAIRDKQLEINRLELDSQRKQQLGLLIGLLLLAVIGGLLYWQNQVRKRTNTTLLHLNSELDEANKLKAKFFAILSHDLRSPIANLISFLNLQKEAPDLLSPEGIAEHQKRITESAENLLDTMEGMLLWSKSQMEHFKPQTKLVEVSTLFNYLQHFFATTPHVAFSFDNPDQLQVVTDEDYLKTIMQNLTANAVNALKNKPNAMVRWEARQQNGQIVLAIIDNGGGMSPQQLSVFNTEGGFISGKTGLGLHLIKDLAKTIACRIAVQSSPQLGTEFQLVFAES
ncbi:MAG: tetratricopeptide repeat-containing sensor histidine kinase [Spirosomataceae bacterium]